MLNDIGLVAGKIYSYLARNGEVSVSTLKKSLDTKPDMVILGLGWLSREEKITYSKKGNSTKIALAKNY